MNHILDAQQHHWERTFLQKPEMFGTEPSQPAQASVELFREESSATILELGGGQGRDAFFLARSGFRVHVLDYADSAVNAIEEEARHLNPDDSVTVCRGDVRRPLPFEDGAFDACYSHMLYCMALTIPELESLSAEVRRVLRPGGLQVYTARHTGDPQCGTGIRRGDDMYEIGSGFIVHFFSRDTVERLARGFEILGIDEFEEGSLPRKLFRVTLRKC